MKILFVSHETGYTFGTYLEVIAPALVERGHEVHVLNCRPYGPRVSSDDQENGVWVHRRRHLQIRGARRLLAAPGIRTAAAALRAPAEPAWTSPVMRLNAALTNVVECRRLGVDFDVIEAPEHLAEGLGFALTRSWPVAVELHGPLIIDVELWGYEPGWHLRVSDRLERLAARTATMTIAPSQFIADQLAARGWAGARDARVVPHAIDLETWSKVAPASTTRPVVLAVGSVTAAKGADVLVRAAALLARSVPELEVVFAGASVTLPDGGASADEIAGLAASLGVQCRFVGYVPRSELPAWYEEARVVAVASHSRPESFSLAGLEGLASGRPVVCSSNTGIAEIARPEREGLTVVPPADPEGLARGLEPFVRDQARAVAAGADARVLARERSSPAIVAAHKEAAYREAIELWTHRRRARRGGRRRGGRR